MTFNSINHQNPRLYQHYRKFLQFEWLVLVTGLLAIIVPTIIIQAKLGWSSTTGAHGPIVFATGLWLIWHERHLAKNGKPANLIAVFCVLLAAAPLYYIGRVTTILLLEGLAAFVICIAVAAMHLGWRTVARFWFPIFYLLFILSPPENWVFVATRPIKALLSETAVDFMAALGANIAGTANVILINGYQLQVAAACSGVNSIIGITAIGSFYIYLRRGSQPGYAALMLALLIPVAILTNFIRVIVLIIVTQQSGEGVAFDMAHDLGGVLLFMVALVLLITLDGILFPIYRYWGARRG